MTLSEHAVFVTLLLNNSVKTYSETTGQFLSSPIIMHSGAQHYAHVAISSWSKPRRDAEKLHCLRETESVLAMIGEVVTIT